MNKKPERQGSATSGQALAAQYSQLLGTQQLGTEIMASIARTNGFGESFASAQRAGIEAANKVMKSQQTGAELVANVVRAQGTGESFARAQHQMLEMASSLAGTQRLAGAFVSAQTVAAAELSHRFPGIGDTGVRAVTQALAVHVEPLSGMPWFNTAIQAGYVPQLEGVLPPVLRNLDMSQVFRPWLGTPAYRPLGDAGEDLAQWVIGLLSGSATASPERFAEIADRLESVELDEESAQRLSQMAEDEPAVQAGLKSLGIQRFVPQTLGGLLAVSAALGISVSLLMIVGLIWAPALMAIIGTSVGTGAGVGVAVFKGGITFSPGARAQLDAMKPTDPGAEDDGGPAGS